MRGSANNRRTIQLLVDRPAPGELAQGGAVEGCVQDDSNVRAVKLILSFEE